MKKKESIQRPRVGGIGLQLNLIRDSHPALSKKMLVFLFLFFGLACSHGARVRHKSPAFSGPAVLPDLSFGTVSLESMTAKNHWALVLFYPAAWTFVCPTELLAFSDAMDEFSSRNVSVAFVSVDTKHSLLAWLQQPRAEGGLGGTSFRVPLVADVTRAIGQSFDVLIDDESEDHGLALRASFIISPAGVVRHASYSDLPVGRSVDEALRLVSAFQHADANPGKVWESV